MGRGIKTRKEDIQALVDLVKEEIELHKQGKIERLTGNFELENMVNKRRDQIMRYLNQINSSDREYRDKILKGAIRECDKQAIADIIKEEIELHKQGKINRLSTNDKIGSLVGIAPRTISKYLSKLLNEDFRYYRTKYLLKQNGKACSELKKGIHSFTTEQRSEAGIKGYNSDTGLKNITIDERANLGRINGKENKRLSRGIFALNKKQRIEIGTRVGKKNAELKIGFCGMSCEQRRKNGLKVAKLGIGMYAITPERRREISKKGIETIRRNSYFVEGRFYAQSMQEGAVALLLEKYLKYNVKDEENFQVKDKGIKNAGIDFLIDNEFLEWHPIILSSYLRGDIKSNEEYQSYRKVLNQLSRDEKKRFKKDCEKVLAINYRNSRQKSVDKSGYSGKNVALATNIRELYDFISKYSDKLLSFDEFKSEFNKNVRYVKGFKVQAKIKDKQMVGVVA